MSFETLLYLQAALGILIGVLAAVGVYRRRQLGRGGMPLGLAVALLVLAALLPRFGTPPRAGTAGRLRVVSVFDAETTEALVEAFTDRTGIVCDVDPFAGGTQTTVQLIRQGRVQPDVLLGGTVEIHEELAAAGMLLAHEPRDDAYRIASYDDPEHQWTPLYLGYLALVYRPVPTLRTHPPDWLTLIQPRWAGRVSIPSPARSGGGLVFLATQIMRQQEEQLAWDYLELLLARGAHLEARSSLPISKVADGSMDLGVAWAHDILRRQERERLPVELRIPPLTGYEVGGVSILSWAQDPDAAHAFVNFLMGREASQIQVRHGFRVPLRRDVDPPRYLEQRDLGSERTDFYDRQQVLARRSEWVERWRTLTGENGEASGR